MSTTTLRETPRLARIQAIDAKIGRLRSEQADLVKNIASDAEWMDIPVRTIGQHRFDGDGPTIVGSTWHVLSQFWERDGRTHYFGHSAESCETSDRGAWCGKLETPQRNKYERAGDRFWFTFHGSHVLVGLVAREDDTYFKGSLDCVMIPAHS